MAEAHQHVDLEVLHLVEHLLSRREGDGEPAPGDAGEVVPLPAPGAESSTHPAGHVPELPLIPKEPVTPLPRRR